MRALTKYLPALVLFGTVSILRADTPAPAPTPAPAADAASTDPTSLEARQKAAAALSPSEMQAQSQAMMGKLPQEYQSVLYLREQAKKTKDVIKLTCVNDKLVQIKAEMNIADTTNADLQAALANNSTDGRATFFVNLQIRTDSITQLRRDAEVCVGTPDLYKQEAGVQVEHPDLPDPTAGDPFNVDDGDIEPPGYASPFN